MNQLLTGIPLYSSTFSSQIVCNQSWSGVHCGTYRYNSPKFFNKQKRIKQFHHKIASSGTYTIDRSKYRSIYDNLKTLCIEMTFRTTSIVQTQMTMLPTLLICKQRDHCTTTSLPGTRTRILLQCLLDSAFFPNRQLK